MYREAAVLVPTCHPVGGVCKLADYAVHLRRIGYRVKLLVTGTYLDDKIIQSKQYVIENGGLTVLPYWRDKTKEYDLILFSEPSQVERAMKLRRDPDKSILLNLIQNTRHSNPFWNEGKAVRNLLNPEIVRLTITQEVEAAIRGVTLNSGYYVPHGFDYNFFSSGRRRAFGARKIKVGYTNFKSVFFSQRDLEQQFPSLSFVCCKKGASWSQLLKFYREVDIFVSTPLAEEGLYLPGLEAMASGCVVVSPCLKGMDHYLKKNTYVHYELEDQNSLIKAVKRAIKIIESPVKLNKLIESSEKIVSQQSLDHEFKNFLEKYIQIVSEQFLEQRYFQELN